MLRRRQPVSYSSDASTNGNTPKTDPRPSAEHDGSPWEAILGPADRETSDDLETVVAVSASSPESMRRYRHRANKRLLHVESEDYDPSQSIVQEPSLRRQFSSIRLRSKAPAQAAEAGSPSAQRQGPLYALDCIWVEDDSASIGKRESVVGISISRFESYEL